jgi:hypothetical protein
MATFIFYWDCNGIESIIDCSDLDSYKEHQSFNILAGDQKKPYKHESTLGFLILRARYNPQRSPEIYSIVCDDEMDYKFWQNAWQESPQEIADLIRERGTKILSMRDSRARVIT